MLKKSVSFIALCFAITVLASFSAFANGGDNNDTPRDIAADKNYSPAYLERLDNTRPNLDFNGDDGYRPGNAIQTDGAQNDRGSNQNSNN